MSTDNADPVTAEDIVTRLNKETARIGWSELARLFASGVVIVVADGLDLVDVARNFIEDDKGRIKKLLDLGNIHNAETADAERWNTANAEVWAVVVAPWVLVQENKSAKSQDPDTIQ